MKTSPKSTSTRDAAAPVEAEKCRVKGPPDGVGGKRCRHTPSGPAVELSEEPLNVVTTVAPAEVKPQITAD
jgi:hypothetical protein